MDLPFQQRWRFATTVGRNIKYYRIGCCAPAPLLFGIANLLRVACSLFSVCLEPFY
jgi:hypothetical protein